MKIVFIFLLLFSIKYGMACSCAAFDSLKKEDLDVYSHIFKGEILGIVDTLEMTNDSAGKQVFKARKNVDPKRNYMSLFKYKVKVKSYFKGEYSEDVVYVYSYTSGSMCGYPFGTGPDYIIYANDWRAALDDGTPIIFASLCSRTTPEIEKETRQLTKFLSEKAIK